MKLLYHAVRVQLPTDISEEKYLALVHKVYQEVDQKTNVDVIPLWVARNARGVYLVTSILGDMPSDMEKDMVRRFLALTWHCHLLLCYLPYEHRFRKEWLSPCQHWLEIDHSGDITHVGGIE
ncbi:hypothetical protein [Deinococcus cellulosilyticus]|nr:hypothetical protein [Deinococcus cellulosilyticus]